MAAGFSFSNAGLKEILTSQKPVITLPKAIRMEYTTPRQIMSPLNISVMGIENPMDACRRLATVLVNVA